MRINFVSIVRKKIMWHDHICTALAICQPDTRLQLCSQKGQNQCTWWWNTKMQIRWHWKCKWDAIHFVCIAALLSIQVLLAEVLAQSRCSGVVGLCLRIQLVHIPIIETPTVSVYTNREMSYRSRWPPRFTLALLCVQLFRWECWSRNSFAFPEPALHHAEPSHGGRH